MSAWICWAKERLHAACFTSTLPPELTSKVEPAGSQCMGQLLGEGGEERVLQIWNDKPDDVESLLSKRAAEARTAPDIPARQHC